jgi:hypothetical protein
MMYFKLLPIFCACLPTLQCAYLICSAHLYMSIHKKKNLSTTERIFIKFNSSYVLIKFTDIFQLRLKADKNDTLHTNYMCVCVCVCVCARARVRVCVYVCMYVCMYVYLLHI